MAGKLTTHVLDLSHGGPAEGMRLSLSRLAGGGDSGMLLEALTNEDGRLEQPLLEGEALTPGTYELLFFAGDYFRSRIMQGADDALPDEDGESGTRAMFLEEIPIRFTIRDQSGSYHVPLLVAPGGYSSYRGS